MAVATKRRLEPDEALPQTCVVRSAVDWQRLAELAREGIAAVDRRRPGIETSVLVQETGGLAIVKDDQEERVVLGAPFPAEFTGVSVVIRASDGQHTLEWASNDVRAETLARGFARIGERVHELDGQLEPETETLDMDFAVAVEMPIHEVSTFDKVALVRCDHESVRARAADAQQREVVYAESTATELFVSRTRRLRQQLARVTRGIYVLLAGGDDSTVLARAGRDAQGGWEQAAIQPQTWAQLDERIELLPRAEPIEEGEYDIILDGEWAGILAHEGFGHGAEADMVSKNRSRAVDYLGCSVASDLVTLRDDPSFDGRSGSYFFDHEGTLAGPTTIIRAGVLEHLITHRASARALRCSATANGRRQSPLHKAYARMSNTDFVPGTHSFEELVAAVDHGVYLQGPIGGMEDPKGWGIQCRGALAREIRAGAFTGRCFGPVVLTGYVPDLLASIRMISREFESDGMGYCGKGFKEFVKVTSGGPALLLRGRLG